MRARQGNRVIFALEKLAQVVMIATVCAVMIKARHVKCKQIS